MEYLGTEKTVNKINPQVSVCITTYQHAAFIKKCVNSALDQETTFPIEIIIGEDESTDGTRQICKKFAEQHQDSIRLFLRSREDVRYINGHPTGRHNFLETLKAARGKYIAFCDGDDYWIDSQKLQKQYDYMESDEDISMSIHDAYVVDKNEQKKSIFPKIEYQSIIKPERIIEKGGGFCATNSTFFRSNMLLNMPDWFVDAYVGDYSLYLLAIEHGKIGALPDIMSCYRSGHTNSWSDLSNRAQHLNNYLESLKTMLFAFNEYSDHKYNDSTHIRIALEEIYTAFKIILSGKLSYLSELSIHDKKYILSAFKNILKRKLGL